MKICPFLVAGDESLQHRGAMSLRTPVETPRLEITRNDVDLLPQAEAPSAGTQAAAARTTDPVATDLWTLEEQSAPPRSHLECLGEPCRFFHAGGCRFDLLFAPAASAGAAASPSSLLLQEGESDGAAMASVLQEVWSLQRESLKEMIGGFRRFEGEQVRQEASISGRIEQLLLRIEEVRRENPDLARLLDERLATVQAILPALERTQGDIVATRAAAEGVRNDITATLAAVEGSCADIAATRAEIDTTRAEIDKTRIGVDATRAEIDKACAGIDATRAQVVEARADLTATRAAVEEIRSGLAATRPDLTSSRTAMETMRASLESACATLTGAREESRRTLQESLEVTRRLLGESAEETRAKLEQLVAQNSSQSRAELERSLQRVLEDNKGMQGLRTEMQQALQTLAGHVREVATAAASLASSSRLAEDLLVEQRAFAEALLERDRRDEARRLNNAGVLAYHEAAYDTSVEKFRQAVQLDPKLSEAWNNLGLSYTEMQADAEALEAFKKALEIDPNVGQVYNNLGYLYHRRGAFEEAVEMYQRATQRCTDSSAAWSNLGNALHALARRDEAVTAWKRAVELDPTNDKATGALERLGLGASS